MVTIDGEDAKDLDDAVSCGTCERRRLLSWVFTSQTSPTMYRKTVHWTGRPKKRGTSVYLADRVIPMLPAYTLQWDLFSERRGGPAGAELSHAGRSIRACNVDHEIAETRDPGGPSA